MVSFVVGMKASEVENDPQSLAKRCLSESVNERRSNSFNSKMAMAKNVKLATNPNHITPKVADFSAKVRITVSVVIFVIYVWHLIS